MIRLKYPVTPTKNVWNKWHWAKKRRFRKEMDKATIAQKKAIPKCKKVRLSFSRQSKSKRRADPFNITAGLESLIDSLVQVGELVPDDDVRYIEHGDVIDLHQRDWLDDDECVWVFIEDIG